MATVSYKNKQKTLLGQSNNGLVLLFAVNMLVFVAMHSISIIYQLSDIPMERFHEQVLNWLTLPVAADNFAAKPWTLLTHLFTHYGFWHLVSSMVWLWFFGYLLQDMIGNNRVIPVYLYGGLSGAIALLITAALLPTNPSGVTMGAGAGVMAIAIAITRLTPGYRMLPFIAGGIPLWIITVVYVLIDFSTMGPGNIPLAASHLVAAVMGWLFSEQLRKGNDMGAWMNRFVDWLNDLFNPEKKHNKHQKDRHYYRATRNPYEVTPNITQQRVDEILEKIHRLGFDQLSAEEKAFLEKASKED